MTDRIIRIKVDARDATRGINQVENQMESLNSKVNKVAASVAAALATGVLAKFLNDSAQAARNFEASISNLSAITGATGKDLEFLRQTALQFGATTTLSASEAAEALKLVASAKPDLLETGEALREVTRQAILLAEASGSSLADAAKTVGNALNQFGEEADQAARFVNVLAASAKFGSSEIEQTAVALRDSGVAAASAKISFEETNAAIQVLAANGLSGAQSGTALRNIFLKLDNDLDTSVRPSVVGLEQALSNLNAQNLTGAELVKKFGLENIVAARTLIENSNRLGDLTEKLTDTNTAFEQAGTNTDNWSGDLKALNSAFEALQIQIGSKFLGTLRDFTQETTNLIQAINGNEEALKEWGGTFDTVYEIALVFSALVGARLSSALILSAKQLVVNAATALSTKVTYDALGVAVTRVTAAQVAGASASKAATAALALIGGPVGAAVLAAGGLAFFVAQAVISQRETERLAREASGLNKELKETNRVYELYAEKQSKVAASSLSGLGLEELQERFDKSTKLVELYTRRLEQLKQSGASFARVSAVSERIEQEKRVLEEILKISSQIKPSAPAIVDDESARKAEELALRLQDLAAKTSLTSIEYAVFAERQKLINDGFSTQQIDDYIFSFRSLLELQESGRKAEQDEQTAARINERIEAIKLETQTIASELALQRQVKIGAFSQEQADLAQQTASLIQSAITERELILAEKAITDEQKLAAEEAFQAQLFEITERYRLLKQDADAQTLASQAQYAQQLFDLQTSSAMTALNAVSSFAKQGSALQKGLFIATKGVQAAQAYTSGLTAAMLARATIPFPYSEPIAKAQILNGKISAAAILATGFAGAFSGSGGGVSSGVGGDASISQTLPTTPQAAQVVGSFEIAGLSDLQRQLDDLDNDEVLPVSFTRRLVASLNSVQRLEGGE